MTTEFSAVFGGSVAAAPVVAFESNGLSTACRLSASPHLQAPNPRIVAKATEWMWGSAERDDFAGADGFVVASARIHGWRFDGDAGRHADIAVGLRREDRVR